MGFSDLPPIEQPQKFLDTAFQRARKNAREHKLADHEKSRLQREKSLALIKIATIRDYLVDRFGSIIQNYPDFDSLSEFYVQLIRATLDHQSLKKSLGAVQWYSRQVHSLSRQISRSIKTSTSADHVGNQLRHFYGRVSSMMKQVTPELGYLHSARQTMRTYPSIKEEFTICIAGFPNVGKSTLLSKLTSADPEINEYAFTTKTLNVGYREKDAVQLQYIDTPGTLEREDKQNDVELQASLALRYVANVIIVVFDITETCGYTVEQQMKLFTNLKRLGKPMCAFLSKTDLLSEGDIEAFTTKRFERKSIPLYTTLEELDVFTIKELHAAYR